ncbi:hypothetical protein MRX96_037007 [Rhipicephalus microplus]
MQGSCFCGDRQRRAQQVGRLVHSSSMPKPPEVHSRRRRASDLKYLRQTTGAHQRPNHRAREELRAPTGCPLPKLGATGSAAQKFYSIRHPPNLRANRAQLPWAHTSIGPCCSFGIRAQAGTPDSRDDRKRSELREPTVCRQSRRASDLKNLRLQAEPTSPPKLRASPAANPEREPQPSTSHHGRLLETTTKTQSRLP